MTEKERFVVEKHEFVQNKQNYVEMRYDNSGYEKLLEEGLQTSSRVCRPFQVYIEEKQIFCYSIYKEERESRGIEDMKEAAREYSVDEKIRIAEYKKVKTKLEEAGYQEEEVIISPVKTNLLSLALSIPDIIILCVIYILVHKALIIRLNNFHEIIMYVAGFLLMIVLRELAHGAIWSLSTTDKMKSYTYGFESDSFAIYSGCKEAVEKNVYLWGMFLPVIIFAYVPAIIALICGHTVWFLLCALAVMFAGRDMVVVVQLLRQKQREGELYFKHPYEHGYYILRKKESNDRE